MSRSSKDDKQREFARALFEARDYLEFSAAKSDFGDSQYYLAVRNFLDQTIREMNLNDSPRKD